MRFFYPLWLVVLLFTVACSENSNREQQIKMIEKYPKVVLNTNDLQIEQISSNIYVHTSYLPTNDFGNVPCNGMIAVNENEAIVFDATTTDATSEALIKFIKTTLKARPVALVVTHFHEDCLGGAKAFETAAIATYASNKTIAIAKQNKIFVPQNGFDSIHVFQIGDAAIEARYFGEGHTKDNVVGYFDKEATLFGGCLVKELDADKGYLGDANEAAWSETIAKIQKTYPNLKMVIPGHGAVGNAALLDYTRNLFSPKKENSFSEK